MPLKILSADITKLEVDAIVNAANTELLAGGGVCGAIFRAAGRYELQEACNKLAPIRTGEAVITQGSICPRNLLFTLRDLFGMAVRIMKKISCATAT